MDEHRLVTLTPSMVTGLWAALITAIHLLVADQRRPYSPAAKLSSTKFPSGTGKESLSSGVSHSPGFTTPPANRPEVKGLPQ